ncbi:phage integrase central domain-containing protein [Endozoicomonas ascidiicola]|uniref:phage integrase central domain-containing protein n=1 Tax=Endozoicomonas ascidiicola TaxID=1698521 RepID=UPI001FDF80B1|nr:hypothetical protein [Endozoicomonas ascidiicola]
MDPKVFLTREKEAAAGSLAIKNLFEQWYEKYCKKKKATHANIKRSFELHVFPVIGGQAAGQVSLQQWLEILESLAAKTPAIASQILSNSKQMLKWAVKRQLFEQNVLSMITASEDLAISRNVRKRSLNDDEYVTCGKRLSIPVWLQKIRFF